MTSSDNHSVSSRQRRHATRQNNGLQRNDTNNSQQHNGVSSTSFNQQGDVPNPLNHAQYPNGRNSIMRPSITRHALGSQDRRANNCGFRRHHFQHAYNFQDDRTSRSSSTHHNNEETTRKAGLKHIHQNKMYNRTSADCESDKQGTNSNSNRKTITKRNSTLIGSSASSLSSSSCSQDLSQQRQSICTPPMGRQANSSSVPITIILGTPNHTSKVSVNQLSLPNNSSKPRKSWKRKRNVMPRCLSTHSMQTSLPLQGNSSTVPVNNDDNLVYNQNTLEKKELIPESHITISSEISGEGIHGTTGSTTKETDLLEDKTQELASVEDDSVKTCEVDSEHTCKPYMYESIEECFETSSLPTHKRVSETKCLNTFTTNNCTAMTMLKGTTQDTTSFDLSGKNTTADVHDMKEKEHHYMELTQSCDTLNINTSDSCFAPVCNNMSTQEFVPELSICTDDRNLTSTVANKKDEKIHISTERKDAVIVVESSKNGENKTEYEMTKSLNNDPHYPVTRKLAPDLRESFNLSSFLFTSTPHLLRFLPPPTTLASPDVSTLLGAAYRLGSAAAAILRKPPATLNIKNQILLPSKSTKFLYKEVQEINLLPDQNIKENSKHISKRECRAGFQFDEEQNQNSAHFNDSDYGVSDSENCYNHFSSDFENSDTCSSSSSDTSSNCSLDDIIPQFKVIENTIDSSSFLSFTKSSINPNGGRPAVHTNDWFSRAGPDRQAALIGLLNGLGLTSHTASTASSVTSSSRTFPLLHTGHLTRSVPQSKLTPLGPLPESTNVSSSETTKTLGLPLLQPPVASSIAPSLCTATTAGISPPAPSLTSTSLPATMPVSMPPPSSSPTPYRYPPRLSFCLSSLWQSFEEASCYGIESPSVDLEDGTCNSLVFVPYLSALKLTAANINANTKRSLPPVTFSYFENKPPHVRRPLSRQIERLAAGLEVPVTNEQRQLLMDTSTDDLNKEESWLSIYWMPLQQKEASSMAPPPAFLVYYSFASTDDPILAPHSGSSKRCTTTSNSNSTLSASQISTGTVSKLPREKALVNINNHNSNEQHEQPGQSQPTQQNDNCDATSTTTPASTRLTTTATNVSPKLEGLMSATPQLVRFGVLPHRADLRAWGVHSSTSSTPAWENNSDVLHRTYGSLKRINHSLHEWMEAKRIVHPDYEFIRRRLKF